MRRKVGRACLQEDLWAHYGVPEDGGLLDSTVLFGRIAPLVVEIGFGHGEATLAMATADPSRDVLAVDVHLPGAGVLLREVHDAGLTNLRIFVGDAVPVLRDRLRPGGIDEVRVFFPDPWPKARHRHRRLVSRTFVALVASRLRRAGALGPNDHGGRLHCVTDWEPYAKQMLATVDADPLLNIELGGFVPRPSWRPLTRYEEQGLTKGHVIRDLIAHRR